VRKGSRQARTIELLLESRPSADPYEGVVRLIRVTDAERAVGGRERLDLQTLQRLPVELTGRLLG
jgi:hypothetical protein